MKLNANDRSRLVFACLLTGVALPAVWWANEDSEDTGRPNVAAAGLPAADAPEATVSPAESVVVVDPAYLTPVVTVAAPPPKPSVQVGGADHEHIADVTGTYRRGVAPGRCEVTDVGVEGTITVFNPANGQSIQCRAARGDAAGPTVVLSPVDFDHLADFTDAPVTVKIRH